MCWCTPEIRIPFCGKPNCVPSTDKAPSLSPMGKMIWNHLRAANLTGNEDCTTAQAEAAVEAAAKEITESYLADSLRNCPPVIAVWEQAGRAHAIFLSDGRKINVGRDERTSGPAWLEITQAAKITIPSVSEPTAET